MALASWSVAVPLLAALAGAVIGFVGAGTVRLLLDRRQELVRAKAFGRVILDELRTADARLDPELVGENPFLAFGPIPIEAWLSYRTDVASVLLDEEFMALSTVYRAISAANSMSASVVAAWGEQMERDDPHLEVPEGVMEERHMIRLTVQQVGVPSVQWLAEGNVSFWKRRRVHTAMTPDPARKCRCGHRWDCHRWSWRHRRWWRVRWRPTRCRASLMSATLKIARVAGSEIPRRA